MALEMPNSSPSKRIMSRDRKHSFGYFEVSKPSSITAARPQVKSLMRAVQGSSVQPSDTSPPQNDAAAVPSEEDTNMLDQPEASNRATPPVAVIQGPRSDASNRKRTLADGAAIPTVSIPSKAVKGKTKNRKSVSASTKRRKVSKPGFAIYTDASLNDNEAVQGRVEGIETAITSSYTNDQSKKKKSPRAEGAKATLPANRTCWTRTVGKRVKMKRRELLQMQVKPVTRLLVRPRFVRKAKDDHFSKAHLTAAVVREIKSFLGILEPGLPNLGVAEAFSATFQLPTDVDAKIAKGLKAAAVESDPEEGANEVEEPEDDESSKVKATQKAKYLNTPVVHNGLDRSLPPIHNLQDIFEDMVRNGWGGAQGQQLRASVEHVQGRELRVGTMCSGTECPVLALGLINDGESLQTLSISSANLLPVLALKRLGKPTIPFVHVLSCEIASYKQAYIQRNFDPQYLFRDVTELPGEQA